MLEFLKRRGRKRLTREEYRKRVCFVDDFFFSRLMQDEELCRRLAEVLVGVKIKSVKLHQTQRSLKRERHTHGIRLDAYLEDEDRIIVIEMQTANQKWLFKRIRLYQGLLDTATLPAGKSYMSLKDTYIIFLCTFDPVGQGLPVYTVRQTYQETDDKDYDDGTCKILYNATEWEKCKDGEIQAVLKYMQTALADSTLMQDIDAAIEAERDLQSMRSEYMTYDMKLCEVRDETWEEATRVYDMKLCEVRDETREETWGEAWGQAWQEATRDTKLQTAKNLLSMGLGADQIAQATGLSLDEVQALL